jgi:hypothetical protein
MSDNHEECEDCGAHLSCGCTLATPTEAHKAALDALEGVMRFYGATDQGVFFGMSESLKSVAGALVDAGRIVWCDSDGTSGRGDQKRQEFARFVPPPKPKLTAEEVDRAMSIVQEYEGRIAMEPGAPALRTYLTSLTQEGE